MIGGDTGLLLQNRGSFFSLDERHPNRLEPGKRSFHTLIPAMMLRAGQPVQMVGAWSETMGHAQAIRLHPDGFLEGGADPRGDGSAAGW